MDNPDQNSSDKDLYQQGVALGSKIPPEHVKGILSQILQGGAVKDPTAGLSPLGSAASDPAPAIADMQQIGDTTPQTSGWVPQTTSRQLAAMPPRGILDLQATAPRPDLSRVDPSLGTQNDDVSKLRSYADQVENAPQKTNLSAIAQYVDSIAGTNYAKNYTAPLSTDQRTEQAAKLRAMAASAQQNITKDQLTAATAGNKNEMAILMAMLRQQGQQNNPTAIARINGQIQQASDSIHKAPNLKVYTDLANRTGETLFLLNKPDVSVTEANEALQNISNAISRSSATSDFKQKELKTKTLEEMAANFTTMIASNPNQAAPPEVVKLLQKIGSRVLDTYDASISREAKRAGIGKIQNMVIPEARQAAQQATEYYTNGDYMKELRTTYGVPASEFGKFGSTPVVKPQSFPQADWDKLGSDAKQHVIESLQK